MPELIFQDELATPWYPRPVVKFAVLVPIPDVFPTFIQPEWYPDGTHPQCFLGSYYLILGQDGKGRYGSVVLQWENMHFALPVAGLPATAYVKIKWPVGYRVPEACEIVTHVLSLDGTMRENRIPVQA